MDTRKRGRTDFGLNGNGGFKKTRSEMDSSGIGSKSKPCTKFYSIAGCPFGESCHFLHFVPGGYNAVAQTMNLSPAPGARPTAGPLPTQNGSLSGVKSKLCNKFNTAEGCKFGDKCNFAHGEWELGRAIVPSHDDPRGPGPRFNPRPEPPVPGPIASFGSYDDPRGTGSRFNPRPEPPVLGPSASFGSSATARVSVDASLAGAIIGKAGVNSKQICKQTGVKLAIRDHESDPNLKNIELEGTFEQISQASVMVRNFIASVGSASVPVKAPGGPGGPHNPGSNFKTKMCENFTKGCCTFGDRCHFAHGAAELRKSGL